MKVTIIMMTMALWVTGAGSPFVLSSPAGMHTSKACYGTAGAHCFSHHLNCACGTISLYAAYYTYSGNCGITGVTTCNFDINNIPEGAKYSNFNQSELDSLIHECSDKPNCVYKAGRRNHIIFSVVRYGCIKSEVSTSLPSAVFKPVNTQRLSSKNTTYKKDEVSTTLPTTVYKPVTAQRPSSKITTYKKDGAPVTAFSTVYKSVNTQTSPRGGTVTTGRANNIGSVVGAVVPSVLIVGVSVAILVFCLKRKKQGQEDDEMVKSSKNTKQQEIYSLAGAIPDNINLELENPPHNYDYATADGLRPAKDTYYTISDTGDQNGVQCEKKSVYENIEDKAIKGSCGSDKAASVTRKVAQKEMTVSRQYDKDLYSYDHLNGTTSGQMNTTQSLEYDTTASSQKAVANLQNNQVSPHEDSYGYNHIGGSNKVKTIQNDYDTSASAAKAIAELNDRTLWESVYDHVEQTTVPSSTSPYDVAGNVRDEYSLTENVAANNL